MLWEKKIVSLLDDLGFQDVDGARGEKFQLGGHQIDACGGFSDTLLVIECKTHQELKKTTVRAVINEMRGKRYAIKSGVMKDPVYKKYTRRSKKNLALWIMFEQKPSKIKEAIADFLRGIDNKSEKEIYII